MTETQEGLLETAGRAKWARLASTGFLLAAIGPLVTLVAGVIWGLDIGDEVAFFLVTAIGGMAAAAFVRRPRPWQRSIAIVLGLFVGFMLFWTAFSLATPDSFFDFVTGVLVLPGVLIGIGAGIAALLAQRRGNVSSVVAKQERATVLGILGVVAVLVVLSGVLTLTGRETVDDPTLADVVVHMSDFEFDAERYSLEGGATVLVINDDPFLHTFTIDALEIDVDLGPGSEKLVTIPDEPGSYVLYCEPHTSDPELPADDDMAAELQVE